MRLICPNCGAQYEVDEAVIPEQGRDVQCSNCGHTWFQPPAHLDTETAAELGEDAPAAPDQALARQELDPDVANVLREEAEREAAERVSEAEGLESQPDLGIEEADEAAERSAAARARMARLRGVDGTSPEDEAALAAATAGSRKELLPDIEEINSSLRAGNDRDAAPEPTPEAELSAAVAAPAKSRRWGFRLIVILALIALAVYLFAPQIVQYFPQTEYYLKLYGEWVNNLRGQIAPLIQSATDWVQGLIGGGGDAPAAE